MSFALYQSGIGPSTIDTDWTTSLTMTLPTDQSDMNDYLKNLFKEFKILNVRLRFIPRYPLGYRSPGSGENTGIICLWQKSADEPTAFWEYLEQIHAEDPNAKYAPFNRQFEIKLNLSQEDRGWHIATDTVILRANVGIFVHQLDASETVGYLVLLFDVDFR